MQDLIRESAPGKKGSPMDARHLLAAYRKRFGKVDWHALGAAGQTEFFELWPKHFTLVGKARNFVALPVDPFDAAMRRIGMAPVEKSV